jgi:RNA recognition motif-containing protein
MNIYAGNLSTETTEEELRQEFIAFGQVSSVSIINDKNSGNGQARSHGFVEMASKSEGESAIAGLNGKRLKGRVIDIIEALPLSHKKATVSFSRDNSRYNRRTMSIKYKSAESSNTTG